MRPESADLTYGAFRQYWNRREGGSLLDRLLYADQKTYLGKLLMKQDRMSMAASIESRVPFLDHSLVEFSTRIPSNLKLRGNSAKYLLKKACEGILPNEIIYRKKMGFPTPFKRWLLQPEAGPIYRYAPGDPKAANLCRSQRAGSVPRTAPSGHRGRHRSHLGIFWTLRKFEVFIVDARAYSANDFTLFKPFHEDPINKADFLHPTDRGGQI